MVFGSGGQEPLIKDGNDYDPDAEENSSSRLRSKKIWAAVGIAVVAVVLTVSLVLVLDDGSDGDTSLMGCEFAMPTKRNWGMGRERENFVW